MAATHHEKATGKLPDVASEMPPADPHRAVNVASPNLCLVRIDPAADVNEPEADSREVIAPDDRAYGARVISSTEWKNETVLEAFAEPLINADGERYTPTLDELARDLKAKFSRVSAGSLAEAEAILLGQAQALEAIFVSLAVLAKNAPSPHYMERYLAVAFKSQQLCRATITALADLKHPRPAHFVAQQNLAVSQQINNGIVAPPISLEAERAGQ